MAEDSIRWIQTFFSSTISLTQTNLWQPLVDVYHTREGWLIKYDLAGIHPEDVILTVDGRRLTIRGTRRDFCMEEDCHHHRLEISYGPFQRTIEMPVNLERAQINTEFRHGMLLVRVNPEEARS